MFKDNALKPYYEEALALERESEFKVRAYDILKYLDDEIKDKNEQEEIERAIYHVYHLRDVDVREWGKKLTLFKDGYQKAKKSLVA